MQILLIVAHGCNPQHSVLCCGAQVPVSWLQAYLSNKPLAAWRADLVARMDFLAAWAYGAQPFAYWLAAFTYPISFLTAVLQVRVMRLSGCRCKCIIGWQQLSTYKLQAYSAYLSLSKMESIVKDADLLGIPCEKSLV